ncbi:acyl-CoA thioesterase [Rhizobium helianthi]|uniref:Acyl-CoA thioesterase n=1 Tax=Rhizobium helianthi TaxID=1132695 RepID=A0ABW4M6Q2_9HYPH
MAAYVFEVPFRDVGLRGEMFSAAYITHAEEALARFWASRQQAGSDPAFYVSKVSCSLLRALRFGDRVECTVRVSKIGGKSAGFVIIMYRGEERVAEAEVVWTACDGESGTPVPLPEELRDWLYKYLD